MRQEISIFMADRYGRGGFLFALLQNHDSLTESVAVAWWSDHCSSVQPFVAKTKCGKSPIRFIHECCLVSPGTKGTNQSAAVESFLRPKWELR